MIQLPLSLVTFTNLLFVFERVSGRISCLGRFHFRWGPCSFGGKTCSGDDTLILVPIVYLRALIYPRRLFSPSLSGIDYIVYWCWSTMRRAKLLTSLSVVTAQDLQF